VNPPVIGGDELFVTEPSDETVVVTVEPSCFVTVVATVPSGDLLTTGAGTDARDTALDWTRGEGWAPGAANEGLEPGAANEGLEPGAANETD